MPAMRLNTYGDASALSFGLHALRERGFGARGLVFLALEPSGRVLLAVPEAPEDIDRLRIGDKLALRFPVEGRYFQFDSIHRVRPGVYVYNGDRRLAHPGNASDVAGVVAKFLREVGESSVFFGCQQHSPGAWVASRHSCTALHDGGLVDLIPLGDNLALARRILDHRLYRVNLGVKPIASEPVWESPLGDVLLVERRVQRDRLVLTCADGLVEVDVSDLSAVKERERLVRPSDAPMVGVVGRVQDRSFAVTRAERREWGLEEMRPAVLVTAEGNSLANLGEALTRGGLEA